VTWEPEASWFRFVRQKRQRGGDLTALRADEAATQATVARYRPGQPRSVWREDQRDAAAWLRIPAAQIDVREQCRKRHSDGCGGRWFVVEARPAMLPHRGWPPYPLWRRARGFVEDGVLVLRDSLASAPLIGVCVKHPEVGFLGPDGWRRHAGEERCRGFRLCTMKPRHKLWTAKRWFHPTFDLPVTVRSCDGTVATELRRVAFLGMAACDDCSRVLEGVR
jgi:hypothetical protein